MEAADVVALYTTLEDLGIKIWIDGGWSVDALLGRQTRPHNDLDIAVQWKDVPELRQILAARGYQEVREDSKWNFVLRDPGGRELDVHAFVYDEQGNVVDGITYPSDSLTGTGTINGQAVRCISPKYMVEFLAPWIYKWPEKYLTAVGELCKKFGIDLPEEHTNYKKIYRFSPIRIEQELVEAVKYVATETTKLAKKITSQKLPINSLTVFSHYDDEFNQLKRMAFELGTLHNENNGPRVKLHSPIAVEGNKIQYLRIRKPDPERPQVGCNDFDMEDYEQFKREYLASNPNNLRLIIRPEYEMIEFFDPEFDVLAYILNKRV